MYFKWAGIYQWYCNGWFCYSMLCLWLKTTFSSQPLILSLFADSLTFRTDMLHFPIKYNSLMLVILLNATYICPWLKYFWDFKSKLTTPSVKLRSCTLWTVQAHDNVKWNCVLLTDGYCLFLRRPNNASRFFVGTQWYCRAVTSDLIASNPALSSLKLTKQH